MPLELNKIHKGPISDMDAPFAAIDIPYTVAVINKLREHKIRFSVSVNPAPNEGEAICDIFWFYPDDDIDHIQRLIYQVQSQPVA